MASGYHIGQHRYKASLLLQKIQLNSIGLECLYLSRNQKDEQTITDCQKLLDFGPLIIKYTFNVI